MTHSFGCRYNEGVNCLACGPTEAPASREHVFAAWLLREFDPDIAMALFRLNPDGTNHEVRQEIKLDGFKLYLSYINRALGTNMTSEQLGTLIIIHELGHQTSAPKQPSDVESRAEKLTIYNDCIK